jgi:hypothetical protein
LRKKGIERADLHNNVYDPFHSSIYFPGVSIGVNVIFIADMSRHRTKKAPRSLLWGASAIRVLSYREAAREVFPGWSVVSIS